MTESDQEPSTLDDVVPNPENANYVSIIECTECGERGHMYSSHEPNFEYWYWKCQECSPDEWVEHVVVMATDSGRRISS